MDSIIRTENLCFNYTDDETGKTTCVLRDISVNINRGEFIAVLGHNGSGKSTFAKHLNAILTPTSGKVWVDDIDTSDEKRLYDIRKRVGMVFQNPDNQMVANIVEDDVAFAPENLGMPRDEIRKRVDSALAAVNMSEFAMHAPHMLSGGQKQRIAIAGVLAMEPEILVLDEPTAMLDPNGRREIIETVKRLNIEKNMTVVLITHYMEEAVEADRVIVIDSGKIEMDAAPIEVFPNVEKMKALGLDTPQATELAFLLGKSGFNIDSNVLTVSECADKIEQLWKKGDDI
ncbi:MAG: energy-coupling factor transporter ATPase [Clostridia bacterium]|nr:energy-coupling factor transporter ATPase [Clostridia bacterium]